MKHPSHAYKYKCFQKKRKKKIELLLNPLYETTELTLLVHKRLYNKIK